MQKDKGPLIKAIVEFRKRTGLGIMQAKISVEEADLDIDRAIEIARAKGFMTSKVKPVEVLEHGIVETFVSEDKKRGSIVQLLCSTESAARTEVFRQGAKVIAYGLVIEADEDSIKTVLNDLEVALKEPVRLEYYEVYDMRDRRGCREASRPAEV